MGLLSTDLDQKLDEMGALLRRRRADGQSVKSLAAMALSDLNQFETTFSEALAALVELEASTNAVDQLHVARRDKILAERIVLQQQIATVKNAIDQLGL